MLMHGIIDWKLASLAFFIQEPAITVMHGIFVFSGYVFSVLQRQHYKVCLDIRTRNRMCSYC